MEQNTAPNIKALDEARIICETGLEKQIAELISPLLISIDYRLVRTKISPTNGCTLQIMAERSDGSLNIDDCEKIHNLISPALDIEELIPNAYNLEISSPGLSRPLVRKSDFTAHIGFLIKLELYEPINNCKKYKANIINVSDDNIMIKTQDHIEIIIDYPNIKQACVVLSDEIIKATLASDKKAKKTRK